MSEAHSHSPLAQFEVHPIIPIKIAGVDVSFTNASLWMFIAIAAIALLMTMGTRRMQLVPGRWQSISEVLVNFVPIAGSGRWSLANNAMGWLVPRHTYFDATIHCAPGQECTSMQTMSHLQAGSYLAALLIVVLAVSAFAFRRQDV